MKRIYTILTAVLMTATVWAQAPEKMSYQAVIRDASNQLVSNTSIGMQISILQDSATGTAVYAEQHYPTTNANGLVSLEIGGGTVVSGNFSSINWGDNKYFIKTETDINGGTNYTISNTSQLLSVPYALHAKTAESILGDTIHYVGEYFGGGVVFWVDGTGKHGLICAITDQDTGTGAKWFAGSYTNTMAMGNGPYAGKLNTAIIIANQGYGNGNTYAARMCNELQVTVGGKTYGDWYLPSKKELMLMYQNKNIIDATATAHGGSAFGTTAPTHYWSSTEVDTNHAWRVPFDTGVPDYQKAKGFSDRVRAVRSF